MSHVLISVECETTEAARARGWEDGSVCKHLQCQQEDENLDLLDPWKRWGKGSLADLWRGRDKRQGNWETGWLVELMESMSSGLSKRACKSVSSGLSKRACLS